MDEMGEKQIRVKNCLLSGFSIRTRFKKIFIQSLVISPLKVY